MENKNRKNVRTLLIIVIFLFFFNYRKLFISWIRYQIFIKKTAGSGTALRKTAESGSAKNERGSTALVSGDSVNCVNIRSIISYCMHPNYEHIRKIITRAGKNSSFTIFLSSEKNIYFNISPNPVLLRSVSLCVLWSLYVFIEKVHQSGPRLYSHACVTGATLLSF